MENLNKQIKDLAAPGVIEVIQWALMVHENTMDVMTRRSKEKQDLLAEDVVKRQLFYTLDEREEARKILLEYGAGKPTRIVEHRGSKKQPIQFATTIVRQQPQLEEKTIDAEFVSTDEDSSNT